MKPETHYSVIVLGGGTAGTVAAIQAGRAGARTLLVEKNGMLGGTMTVAGVIRADLPRLAHLPPGAEIRFVAVDATHAAEARAAQARLLAGWRTTLRPAARHGDIPTETLLAANLAGAALRGDEEG